MTQYQDLIICGGKKESPPAPPQPLRLVSVQVTHTLWAPILYGYHAPSLYRHHSDPNPISSTLNTLTHRAGGLGKIFLSVPSWGFLTVTCAFVYICFGRFLCRVNCESHLCSCTGIYYSESLYFRGLTLNIKLCVQYKVINVKVLSTIQ